jgi:hypothetical protein
LKELDLVTWNGDLRDVHVMGEVEVGVVHPERPAQSLPRLVEDLSEPRHEVEASFHSVAGSIEPEAPINFQEGGAVNHA